MTDPSVASLQLGAGPQRSRSLWGDAWRRLRKRQTVIASAVIIVLIVLIAIAPGLFSSREAGLSDLNLANQGQSADAWFGYDNQGQDVYARAIYGTRASLLVGVFATLLTVLIGSFIGILAGYYGQIVDTLLSRLGDVFAGLPFLLGAIVIFTTFNAPGSSPGGVTIISQVVLSIAILTWPVAMRIMRGATLVAKQLDYVKAARGLGASTPRVIFRHLLPNALASVLVLVYATIALGAAIGAEATLAYLGIGVRAPVISWGVMISDARDYFRNTPHILLFPAAFVTVIVLAFVMLGDAVRDALDPKGR